MVDFETQNRHHGYKFNTPEKTQPVSSHRDLNRETSRLVFSEPRVQVHDCRPAGLQAMSDAGTWDGHLMAHGVTGTVSDLRTVQHRERPGVQGARRPPGKLLAVVGDMGRKPGRFLFPRSIAAASGGDIFVADSKNHRVQRLNQCGVLKSHFGSRGTGPGQFDEPTGVAVFENNDVLVADKKNKRIQVFFESIIGPASEDSDEVLSEFKCKYEFPTSDEPYYVTCDAHYNIIVSCVNGFIEIYNRRGKQTNRFHLSGKLEGDNRQMASPIAINNKDEVLVNDVIIKHIIYFTYGGKMLYKFQPASSSEGMSCDSAGICVTPVGAVIVADALNHVINEYTERGALIRQILSPTDGVGSVRDVLLGPEGHLITCDYAANGQHGLRIFRHTDCECHQVLSLADLSSRQSKRT